MIKEIGTYENDRIWQSNAYVFCLLKQKDKQTVNPLNLNQWQFFIVPTALLDKLIRTQKTIAMSFFEKNDITPRNYSEIHYHLEQAIDETAVKE